jgi:hypothetical protein
MEDREPTKIMTESNGSDLPPPETPSFGADAEEPAALPDAAAAAAKQQDLPKLTLIQAGLAVFDGVLIVVFAALWFLSEDTLFQILQRAAGFCLLLALVPIVLGGVILNKNKKADAPMPGTMYATLGMWIGVLLSMMTLLIPTVVTFRALFDSPGAP